MMRDDLVIPCGCCRGTGRVALPRELFETLRFVERNGSAQAPEVFRWMQNLRPHVKMRPTSANQRLARLVDLDLGFLRRCERLGRAYVYEMVDHTP